LRKQFHAAGQRVGLRRWVFIIWVVPLAPVSLIVRWLSVSFGGQAVGFLGAILSSSIGHSVRMFGWDFRPSAAPILHERILCAGDGQSLC
jgi:hypothetical protein